jgi:threonylcarbamoyladenosine tRNA methylthiotransferase MtaB
MKRRYNTDLFKEKVLYIKKRIPDACIAADVITGFPGESTKEFEETYRFIESLPLSYLHVFTYSDRPDALASKMENKVSAQKKKERSQQLHNLSDKILRRFYEENAGTVREVLFEETKGDEIFGWTDNYVRVKTSAQNADQNVIRRVILASTDLDGAVKATIA